MFELLDRLRSQSEHYRRTVAIVVVSIITGIIFLVWAVGSLSQLSNVGASLEGVGLPPKAIESASAFSSLQEQIGAILEGGAEAIDSIRGPIEYNSSDPVLE